MASKLTSSLFRSSQFTARAFAPSASVSRAQIKYTSSINPIFISRRNMVSAVSTSDVRHLMTIADLTPKELNFLIDRSAAIKAATKAGEIPEATALKGKTVAVMFSKRSTRTRISTEGAVTHFGGHAMFLGKDDIQLGVNESLYDTSRVISSMVSCIVARVNGHSEVANLAKDSSVPVINALSDAFHPLQALADILTIKESFPDKPLNTLKLAWVGDANNVLHDLMFACAKVGIKVSIATPKEFPVSEDMLEIARAAADEHEGCVIETTHAPEEAVKGADIIVTDTWISMGQESEKLTKLKQFAGYQVTNELAERGGANADWKFMHCLPRHQEEVSDEVFYSPRSVVFEEAENRLWTMIAALETFVVKKGRFE
ncbi:ornithine carbamoyltransferase [Saitoella coloradoensis]